MSTYQQTYDMCKDLPTDNIRHRLSCDKGRLDSGSSPTPERDRERVRAYEYILSERQEPEAEEAPEEPDHPIEYMIALKYKSLYESARRRSKAFDLSFKDVRRLLERKTCAYTGVRLTNNKGLPTDRTIDRMDHSKGYVKGNVYAVSDRANQVKNELFERVGGINRMEVNGIMAMCQTLSKLGFEER